MRKLLNLLAVILEDEEDAKAKTLNPAVLLKRPGRFDSFIKHIATKQPFLSKEGYQVIIDPMEAKRIEALHNSPGGTKFKGAIELKVSDGNYIPLSSLLKTSEFGGQLAGSAIDDPNQQGKSVKGKAAFKLNPAQIKITDRDINAEDFGDVITHNPVLESTDYGKGGVAYRACYSKDKTGHTMLSALYNQALKLNIKFFSEFFVSDLLLAQKDDIKTSGCHGCVAIN